MLTTEEVAAVPLFSGLPPASLERLARTSADLHLGPGEFAVPEGGERALFAVLSGRIEVVKTIDGIERRLGFRLPGTIFGEVPIALGTPFPGGYRAVEPSRVMRIDPQQYYAIAAVPQDISLNVGGLGGERAGLAAAVYGASEGLRTIVIEREAPGGQAGTSARIENYLGFPNGVSGDELASRALQQARRLGAEILVTRCVAGIDPATREVFLDGDDVVRARTLILATGVT